MKLKEYKTETNGLQKDVNELIEYDEYFNLILYDIVSEILNNAENF